MRLSFMDQHYSVDEADFVVLPVEYDRTTSGRSGTAEGPLDILRWSKQPEYYDMDLDYNLTKHAKIAIDEAIGPSNSPNEMVNRVERRALELLNMGKFVVGLGGEHSITCGLVRAQQKFRKEKFSVLYFDAHDDFRHEYEDSLWSHACVARRISDFGIPLVQVGVRSTTEGNKAERERRGVKVFSAFDRIFKYSDFPLGKEIVASLSTEFVYVSFDVDVLDTPCTGTPEPYGLSPLQVRDILKSLAYHKKVIGADFVEFRSAGEVTPKYAIDMVELMYGFMSSIHCYSQK